MPGTKSIADIIATGAAVQPHEAVAIIQQLITPVEEFGAELDLKPTRQDPPSLGVVCLGGDGSVVCGASAATRSVLDMAKLLDEMLPRGGRTLVPGALRYTVARAMGDVDAPRFNSIADFSTALKRHEQGDRHTVLRELYSRTAPVDPVVVTVQEAPTRSAGFNSRRWLLGGIVAVVMSFGLGYIVVDRMTPHATRPPMTGLPSPVTVARADLAVPADADTAHEIASTTADPPSVERNDPVRSVYTPLSGRNCTMTKEDKGTGSFVRVCPGVAGSRLLIASDDERMSVSVVTQDDREHPLDYAEVIAPGASRLGTLAEWRIIDRDGKETPVALIVRVYTKDDASRSPKPTSYLAVAKLTSTEICVTDRIPAAASANDQARRASVVSATRACLKPV